MIPRAPVPGSRPPLAAAVVLTVAALFLGGCSTDGPAPSGEPTSGGASGAVVPDVPAELERFYTQTVTWEECTFDVPAGGAGDSLRCADVEVPLDYDDPGGETTTVVMSRLPAEGRSNGSLLFNPGGPGVSGVDAMLSADYMVTDDVRRVYDLVGFDPRGVGRSAGIECLDDEELDEMRAAPAPDPAERPAQQVREQYEQIGAECVQRSGDLVAEMGTESAARDLDVMRAVLGDRRADYLGFSYGTHLGAMYAELFPERVGRFVLDGGVDPTLSSGEATVDQARAFEENLRHWIRHCQAEIRGCVFGGATVDEATARIQELIASVEEGDVTAPDGRTVSATNVVEGVLAPLYSTRTYPVLDDALSRAFDGDLSALMRLSDSIHGRDEEGRYTNNTTVAFTAVTCLDRSAEDVTDAQIADVAARLRQVSPTFGPFLGHSDAMCQGWPVGPEGGPRPIDAAGAEPLLVVGTTHDPATPYAWSEALVEQLDAARLLTYEGWGHLAYTSGNRCVQDAVDDFLVKGELPPEGATCS